MKERTIRTERAFDGRLLKVDVVEVDLGSGRTGRRELIRHPGAIAVLARVPDGRYVFVRQFRKAVEADFLEVVAGTLDPGEDREACVARELREETGHQALEIVSLGSVVPTPGYCDEAIHVFYARADAEPGEQDPDEDEALDVVYLTGEEVEAVIRDGTLRDAKSLATWLLYDRKLGAQA
jgi:ADP-ribose pyrophosphatase